ncbi:MAG: uroporphyrinogen decarboxylase family protein [Synergistaceae bacterium]|jgi:uroporphyrinogen decarboxylase|nr:uroporphyrinogen decarboxylase family protein [Synergistaceae bacterium]
MKDSMTPKERKKAIAEGRPYDRLPHGFAIGDAASRVTGISVTEFHNDAGKRVEATVAAYKEYGLDGVGVAVPLQEIMGVEMAYPEDSTPYVSKHVDFGTEESIERVGIDDLKDQPEMRLFWQVLDGLFEAVGDEAPVSVGFSGPFSVAGRVWGTPMLMRGILRRPDHVHRLLEKILNIEIEIVESLKGYDVGTGIADPVASGTLISPTHFREFAKPYETRLFDAMARVTERKPRHHICGDTSRIINDMVETGAGTVSVDDMMDLNYVIEQVGARAIVAGNVSPTKSMLLGTPEIIREDLRNNMKKGAKAPGGFIVSFGCGLPINTPIKNLHSLFDSFREFSKYPFDPEAL